MPSARYILTLLVIAQVIFYSVWELREQVSAGLIKPLLGFVRGDPSIPARVTMGPFDIGAVIGGFVSCLFSILLCLLLLRLVFAVTWRWIARLLPPVHEPAAAVPPDNAPRTAPPADGTVGPI